MLLMLLSLLLIIMIVVLIFGIFLMLSEKSFKDREKSSPFECGFDPFSSSRLPFSLRFFLIAIIFLIFDIEIVLILPFPISMGLVGVESFYYVGMFFFLILLMGLFHEWNEGALEWVT